MEGGYGGWKVGMVGRRWVWWAEGEHKTTYSYFATVRNDPFQTMLPCIQFLIDICK